MNGNGTFDTKKTALFNQAVSYADRLGNRRGLEGGLSLVAVTGHAVDVIAHFGRSEHGSLARHVRVIYGGARVFEAADRVSTKNGEIIEFNVMLYIPGDWEKSL